MEFKANIIIRGKIECLTGLHIGGSKDKIEIGGVDSVVLRNPHSLLPYIPGSSIKGKLRHILEFSTGAVLDHIGELGSISKRPDIVRIFGIGADQKDKKKIKEFDSRLEKIGPTRLVVRDAFPDTPTKEMWKGLDDELPYTEVKAENTLDRLTSAANPRFIERVVPSSKFDFEIVYSVYDMGETEQDKSYLLDVSNDLKNILSALRQLEDSALGKSGSRGYGKVKFHLASPITVSAKDYQDNTEKYKKASQPKEEEQLTSLADFELIYLEKKEE